MSRSDHEWLISLVSGRDVGWKMAVTPGTCTAWARVDDLHVHVRFAWWYGRRMPVDVAIRSGEEWRCVDDPPREFTDRMEVVVSRWQRDMPPVTLLRMMLGQRNQNEPLQDVIIRGSRTWRLLWVLGGNGTWWRTDVQGLSVYLRNGSLFVGDRGPMDRDSGDAILEWLEERNGRDV